MAFSQTHDEWMRAGLVDATFTLHVVPSGNGSWGQVEGLPADVYFCDFEQYDPPQGFPVRDVCCIRTEAAWWIILTKPVFDRLQQLGRDGELPQGFTHAMTMINERQIGAWLLVRDKGLSGEQALEHMNRRLFEKYGQDYASVETMLESETSEDQADPHFDEEDFGKEPLEMDVLEDITSVLKEASDRNVVTPGKRVWVKRFPGVLHRLNMTLGIKMAGVLVLVVVLIVECPRIWRLSVDVYGPSTVDLKACFPKIRWIDRTSESVLSASHVSRSLFQAVSHRNPFQVAGSIVEVSVRDSQGPDEYSVYHWKILLDDTEPQDEMTAQMSHLSGKEMRDLQNALSDYKSLKLILAFKLFMTWGHNGRFIVIFTGLCVAGLGLLIRCVLKQMQRIQTDMAVRGVAAHGKILESVAQDVKAAENLMLFNQQRRLRIVDKGAAHPWEKEAFDWVKHQVDPDTGKTKRRKRDDRLKEKRKKAFTLIELLVVIAIIAVLMGILIPSLRRVMQQGRAVVCMNHLKQWSYCFEMYTSEHDARFMPGIDEDWSTGKYSWIYTLMKFYNEPEIRLCPEAKKTETQGGQLPWTAWDVSETNPSDFSTLTDPTYKVGSYGINWWVASSSIVVGTHDAKNKWRTTGQKGAANIPVLMDCGFMLARPEPSDPAPEQDGEFLWAFGGGMRRVCTNRHRGRVNILFMDWSTRKVRLKDLWKLKWHKGFDPGHPLPAWPDWIEVLP